MGRSSMAITTQRMYLTQILMGRIAITQPTIVNSTITKLQRTHAMGSFFTVLKIFRHLTIISPKNGLGGGSSSSEIAVVNYPGVSWQDGRLEGNRCWNSGGGQKYGINLQGTGTAIIVIGNDLLGNATSSLSDTSSGASKIITNNICTSGPC